MLKSQKSSNTNLNTKPVFAAELTNHLAESPFDASKLKSVVSSLSTDLNKMIEKGGHVVQHSLFHHLFLEFLRFIF
jgi:hypothetical protein